MWKQLFNVNVVLPGPPSPPIYDAIEKNQFEVVRQMIERDPAVVHANNEGDEPLHYAAWQNRPKIADLLITQGAAVNVKGHHGMTPLHYAAKHESVKVAKLLIKHGAELDARDMFGFTPLFLAIAQRSKEGAAITDLMLSAGASIDIRSAVLLGRIDRVRELFDTAGDAIRKDSCFRHLLPDAVGEARSDVLSLAFQNVDAETRKAVVKKHRPLIELLISQGCDVNSLETFSGTLLSTVVASPYCGTELAAFLLERGADVHARFEGKTALQVAREAGHDDAVELLKRYGAVE